MYNKQNKRFQISWTGTTNTYYELPFDNINVNERFKITQNNTEFRVNQNNNEIVKEYEGDATGEIDSNINIFSSIRPTHNGSWAEIYYLKIFDNNMLIRNFIPVINKNTSEVGLYDTITNSFLTHENLEYT